MSCQPSRPGTRDVEDDEVRVARRRSGAGRRGRSGRSTVAVAGRVIHSSTSAANSGSSSTMRIVSATRRAPRPRSAASGSVKVTRVPGRPSGRSPSHRRPPWASTRRRQMNRPRPVPGIRDSRTFQARWNGSVTSARSASGTPTPSSSTVTASHGPSVVALDDDRRAVRRVLERVADEVRQDLADARDVDVDRRQVGRRRPDEAIRAAGDREVAAQPRDERRERGRRSLEDERIGLEVGDVEDLVDERRQAAASPRRCARRTRAAGPARDRGGGASRRSRG